MLRNTMRTWLQKQKKKVESKAVAEAATPAAEPTPAPAEVQPTVDGAEKPVESIEDAPAGQDGAVDQSAAGSVVGDTPRPASAAPQQEEVSMY